MANVDRLAPAVIDEAQQVEAWAASGAMALTGRADRPALGPPLGLVPELGRIGGLAASRAARFGGRLEVDALALLGERAAIVGLRRRGAVSCGGATRLLPVVDGWLAVTLARPDDVDLVPAWLGLTGPPHDVWGVVGRMIRSRAAIDLVDRAQLLGLPVGSLPIRRGGRFDDGTVGESLMHGPVSDVVTERLGGGTAAVTRGGDHVGTSLATLPVRAIPVPGAAVGARPLGDVVVVDLSSLWAGPLCGALLAEAGAGVIKVESMTRPDGARGAPASFFDLLNASKRSLAVDLGSSEGIGVVRALLERADVVIEASRPRALRHLGLDAASVMVDTGPSVWVSITGYGRDGPNENRVAFGDDAAIGGGLVSWDADGPCFCADAVADPVTGLVAAAAALDALAVGGRWLLDVSMRDVAAHFAGPTLVASDTTRPAPPRARIAPRRSPRLGEHTSEIVADLRSGW